MERDNDSFIKSSVHPYLSEMDYSITWTSPLVRESRDYDITAVIFLPQISEMDSSFY